MSLSEVVSFPQSFPALETQRLLLREMMEADVPAWFERLNDPESSYLSGDPIPDSQVVTPLPEYRKVEDAYLPGLLYIWEL